MNSSSHFEDRADVPPVRKRRRRSGLVSLFRFLLLSVFVAVSVVVGIVSYWLLRSPDLREAATVAVSGGLSPDKAFPGRDEINILLLGRDEDRDNRGQVMDTNGRTDTILVAHFDFRDRLVNVLSIPRDTLVRIPGWRGRHKVNAANQFGGPELTAQTIAELIDVQADGYVLVDYQMFASLIDRVGGVAVEVDKPLHYDDNWGNLHIHLEPGTQVLTGQQALGLVRYRKSNDGRGDSDMERIARQQRLLASVREQFTKPSSIVRLPDLLSTALDGSKATLTLSQALCLANFARSLEEGRVRMEVLPSTETRTVTLIDRTKADALVNELFYDTSSQTENPS